MLRFVKELSYATPLLEKGGESSSLQVQIFCLATEVKFGMGFFGRGTQPGVLWKLKQVFWDFQSREKTSKRRISEAFIFSIWFCFTNFFVYSSVDIYCNDCCLWEHIKVTQSLIGCFFTLVNVASNLLEQHIFIYYEFAPCSVFTSVD